MKRIMTLLAAIAICAVFALQAAEVSDRHQGARGNHTTGQQHRQSGKSGSRPSARPAKPSGDQKRKEHARPGRQQPKHQQPKRDDHRHDKKHDGGRQQGLRPGAGGNHAMPQGKPGKNHHDKGNSRPVPPPPPGHNHHGGPGYGDHRPGGRPGQRPAPHRRPHYGHVPKPHRPWHRPVPPHNWRPRRGVPTIGTILGLTIGTTFNATLSYLTANNYALAGYTPEEIVVTGVPMYGFTWPTARLLYSNGALYGSQYVYPTAYYDNSRYNALYNMFCNTYGMPVSVSNTASGYVTTWFGAGRGFITLSLEPLADQYGRVSYYTTVTMGR